MASRMNNNVPTSGKDRNEMNYMTEDIPVCKKNNYSFVSMLYFVVMIFALYLSFLCNNGFDLGSFAMAVFFPYIYIIYKLATVKNFCGLINLDPSA